MDAAWRFRMIMKRLLPNWRHLLFCGPLLVGLFLLIQFLRLRQEAAKNINLYVVEEHHEVVQYWYQETLLKNLNKSGNILIHVDGHSDMGPPNMFPGFPQLQWPSNIHQVSMMMQANDVFIQASAINGLFDHIIWIRPSWDRTFGQDEFRKFRVDIGYKLIDDKVSKQFCECRVALEVDGHTILEERCHQNEIDGDWGEYVPLERKQCHLIKSMALDIIPENGALDFLQRQTWNDGVPSIILDIDEDFFGCESGYKGLTEAGVSLKLLDELNDKINAMMCPGDSTGEDKADRLIKSYISRFIKECGLSKSRQRCVKGSTKLSSELGRLINASFGENHAIFCSGSASETMNLMSETIPTMRKFSLEQLRSILSLGFCLETSPATWKFNGQFLVCSGTIAPGEDIVQLHTPDPSEIADRKSNFSNIMDRLMTFDLRVVTVCRSVRDGYTPRHLANTIEDGILKYFKEHETKWDFKIVFDDNLLGGKSGWNGRTNPTRL